MHKKILCIGNNDKDTDRQVTRLAEENNSTNHGLINSVDFIPAQVGYYHTTVIDLPAGKIVELSKQFDQVMLLDQPIEQWSNEKLLFTTVKLFNDIANCGVDTIYLDNQNVQRFLAFDKFLKENKSFCIYPWINFVEDVNGIQLCARSAAIPIQSNGKDSDWVDNPQRNNIRQRMLNGEKLPEYCKICYDYEDKGVESYRQFDTQEWVNHLGIDSVDDLKSLTHPYFYELRLSNKCNLMCRGCNPDYSHLIEKEFKQFNIKSPMQFINEKVYSTIDRINIPSLNQSSRVYLTGGDPTVIPDVYTFMERCIEAGKTDFQFTLGINGQKISEKFLNLCNHFSTLNFSVSLDGYGKVNDYWRWGSDFDTIIKNTKLLQSFGHNISINMVPGIYNVTNLHLLYEFLDREFPSVSIYLQLNYIKEQNPYNHPNVELAMHSLERCRQTSVYYSNGKSNKTGIDSLYEHYKTNPKCNTELLKKFFKYNDQLDLARGSKLGDYIPELEAVRYLVDQ